MSNKRFNFLIIISILWIAGIFSFYIFGLFERPSSFNELGDFLAGIFAPVAFFWLVYGYFQNSYSIKLQTDELKETVKAQTDLVKMQSNQIMMMHNSVKPKIRISFNPIEFIEIKDQISENLEKIFPLNLTMNATNNEARYVQLVTFDETIHQTEDCIRVGEPYEFKIYMASLNDSCINDFIDKRIEKYDFGFYIRFQNIYGLIYQNKYSFKLYWKQEKVKIANLNVKETVLNR